MPRRLNIERRRKRIRHYTARRRRRSPVRRALAYWWGTVAIGAVAALMFGAMAFDFLARRPARQAPPRRRPGLCLVSATAEEVSGVVRTGNARRLATALSDREIGISLAPRLPEPTPRTPPPLPPLPETALAVHGEGEEGKLLPAFMDAAAGVAPMAGEPVRARSAATLAAAGFRVGAWPALRTGPAGVARFWLSLDAEGRPETVLRLAPKGAENDWLRALRMALFAGRGKAGAQGIVTVTWNAKEGI